jgi:hypothetical protein
MFLIVRGGAVSLKSEELKNILALPYSLLAIHIKASRKAVLLNTCIDMVIMSIDSDLAECGINKQVFIEGEKLRAQYCS